jgi:hypothetical protein
MLAVGRWLAIAAIAAHVAASARGCIGRIAERWESARERSQETFVEALARTRGAPYARAIENARERIPRNASYALVQVSDVQDARFLVRYDLAPRRAVFLGRVEELAGPAAASLDPEVLWVVVARLGDEGPLLLPVSGFEDWLRQHARSR